MLPSEVGGSNFKIIKETENYIIFVANITYSTKEAYRFDKKQKTF